MKNVEKTLTQKGFALLSEKEQFLYYQKEKDTEQICIVYDKKQKTIRSMDTYTLEGGNMNIISHKPSQFQDVLRTS
ncbi:hypothetical protein IMZ31_20235 (plasmid) [Pontibacillus sp. ALD_SL1]|uniref:hypothetical protein n=1 Tax=Pontibacillus sp. ALD_SL1 TaxID=2777185 RepID=UPI001A96E844|nr:hypothetical protein [Pontibacillus sp. ALD_SL1]QST02880.1 hypothetical protein IMZ31_20235 [Pontibacillus sp. ALD_SL1]